MSLALDRSGGDGGDLGHRDAALSWGLWWRQIQAVLRLEVRKTLLGWRSLPVYFLAGLPVMVCFLFAVFPIDDWQEEGPSAGSVAYAWIYQAFILRAVIFFGSVGIFTNLIRGEVLDRSLHYYFLTPLRREVLVVGKFLAGLLITATLFMGTTLVTHSLIYVPFGGRAFEYMLEGPGLGQLGAYLGVSFLACLGYGAVFLTFGLLFRNPIIPAGVVMVWELMNFLLPPLLKRVSVIFYLKGLCPVPLSEGPFAVLVEPPPTWLSVSGLLLLTAVVLTAAGWRIRRMEIHYSQD